MYGQVICHIDECGEILFYYYFFLSRQSEAVRKLSLGEIPLPIIGLETLLGRLVSWDPGLLPRPPAWALQFACTQLEHSMCG